MRILDFSDGFTSASAPSLLGFSADGVSVTPGGNLSATDVQAALVELQGDVDALNTGLNDVVTDLQTDIDSRALASDLADHVNDTSAAHSASAISNSPSGNLAATTVQGALNELQTELDGLSGLLTVATKSADYTATTSDQVLLVSASGAARTITLYAASGNAGRVLRIMKTDSSGNNVTIDANSTEVINASLTYVLSSQYECVTLLCDGTGWTVVANTKFGQKVESTFSVAAWPIAAGTYGDLTSVQVPAGQTWILTGLIQSDNNGAVTTTQLTLGISTASGTGTTGLVDGNNLVYLAPIGTTSGNSRSLSIPNYVVSPTTTTTYYLKGVATTSITNLRAGGRLTAVRIA